MSRTGALLAVGPMLKIGDEVTMSFRAPPTEDREHTIKGRIVRLYENAEDPKGYWPHRVAVEFIEPLPDVEPILKELSRQVPKEGDPSPT